MQYKYTLLKGEIVKPYLHIIYTWTYAKDGNLSEATKNV